MTKTLGNIALAMLTPPLCPLCDGITTSRGICAACWPGIQLATQIACRICAIPFPHGGGDEVCTLCRLHKPAFDAARAAVLYNDTARQLIPALKHGDRLDIAPVLARLMVPNMAAVARDADMLIPMPLHKRRFRRRRFNQSAEIARHFMRLAGIPKTKLRPDILERIRDTQSQGRMTKPQRRRNLRGAFAITAQCRADKTILKGKNIALLDDVLTTGATMNEAAKVLKKAGAGHVTALVVARVPEKKE